MKVVEGDEVETAEVHFVPCEDDFGVFSGGESDYSDVEPVPVVLDETVEVEDEGDVVIEDDGVRVEELEDEDEDRECYNEWQKRNMDKRKIEEVYDDIGGCSEGTQKFVWDQRLKAAKFWKGQVEVYEGKIFELKEKLDEVTEGFMAAKRLEAYQASEVKRLVRINLDRISDVERWRERCHKLAETNCREEMKYEAVRRNKRLRIQELKKELEEEKRRNANLELELSNTRKRLLTFTRRSIPRRNKVRVVRRVNSNEDEEESTVSVELSSSEDEQKNINKLIDIMHTDLMLLFLKFICLVFLFFETCCLH